MTPLRRIAKRAVSLSIFTGVTLLSTYIAICIFALVFADKLIFPRFQSSYVDNGAILRLPVSGDATIAAVYLPGVENSPTLLFSHGNAEDIGHVYPLMQQYRDFGFNVMVYDYPGYGTSEGKPTEQGTYAAIRSSYSYLVDTLGIDPRSIILYGRSVGSGPSVDLAAEYEVGGVILESPFISAFRVITPRPIFPWDKFDNQSKIERINAPLLIIHGTDDELIELEHGKRLLELANEPKYFFWVEGGRHNDVISVAGDAYWQVLERFTREAREHSRNQTL